MSMNARPLASRSTGSAMVALAGVTALTGLWRWAQLVQYMRIGETLADGAKAFERRTLPHAPTVLVVGDSTGVGTGATTPAASIAGLLGAAFPHVSVVNLAVNGARTLDVIMQLAGAAPGRYDLVLVHAGGNDVLRRTPFARARSAGRCADAPRAQALVQRRRYDHPEHRPPADVLPARVVVDVAPLAPGLRAVRCSGTSARRPLSRLLPRARRVPAHCRSCALLRA
jgi:hypothetical protein